MKSKIFYVRFTEEEYHELPSYIVQRATVIDDDFKKYAKDPLFISLYSKLKKAKKDFENYKFDKRHE